MCNKKFGQNQFHAFMKQDWDILIEELPVHVFIKDTEGRYVLTSRLCEVLAGGDGQESIRGKTDAEVQRDPELGRRFLQEDLEIVRTGREFRYMQEITQDGEPFFYEIHRKPLRRRNGEIFGILGAVTDMTDLIRTRREMEYMSQTDYMTGVYNRAFLDRRKAAIRDSEYPMAVIVTDVDDLKKINDTYGHDRGDAVILAHVENLRRHLDLEDEIVRFGGDEFLIFCPRTDEAEAEQLIRRMQSTEKEYRDGTVWLSASYGCSVIRDGGSSADEAIKHADMMMYRQKQAGGRVYE